MIQINDYYTDEDHYGDQLALCKTAFKYYNEYADIQLSKARDKYYVFALMPIIPIFLGIVLL